MARSKSVDEFIAQSSHWQDELVRLRKVLLATGLTEEIKWRAPCYTLDGKNIVGIGSFKSYFGLWFFQGGLLKDDNNVLVNAQAGKTKAMRQWRMSSSRDIKSTIIKRYVKEAIAHSKEGRAIKADRRKPIVVPAELKKALAQDKTAAVVFRRLRPGLQREYADYIAEAKQPKTKTRRLQKIVPMIASGIGLNDKYR